VSRNFIGSNENHGTTEIGMDDIHHRQSGTGIAVLVGQRFLETRVVGSVVQGLGHGVVVCTGLCRFRKHLSGTRLAGYTLYCIGRGNGGSERRLLAFGVGVRIVHRSVGGGGDCAVVKTPGNGWGAVMTPSPDLGKKVYNAASDPDNIIGRALTGSSGEFFTG
jgi:hypothetical protein